jgi:hypothetical protein
MKEGTTFIAPATEKSKMGTVPSALDATGVNYAGQARFGKTYLPDEIVEESDADNSGMLNAADDNPGIAKKEKQNKK